MEKEINGKIYLIYNNFDKNRYVGQTINSVEERFKAHKQGTRQPKKNMSKLQLAMEHHGKKNFFIKILAENISDTEKLAQCERFYIQLLGTENEYNSSKGGESPLRNNTKNKETRSLKINSNLIYIFNGNKTSTEMDLLLLILIHCDNKKLEIDPIKLSFKYISETLNLTKSNPKEIKRLIIALNKKLESNYLLKWIPISNLQSNETELVVTIKDKLKQTEEQPTNYLINTDNFLSLDTNYSKLLYNHLMATKAQRKGRISLSLEEIEHYLDVPKSYSGKPYILNEKVLKPAMIAVSPFFDNLELEKIRSGRKITHYLFTFTAKRIREKVNYNKKPKKIKSKTEEFSVVNDDEYEEMLEGLI